MRKWIPIRRETAEKFLRGIFSATDYLTVQPTIRHRKPCHGIPCRDNQESREGYRMKTNSRGLTFPVLIGAGLLLTCAMLTRWSVGSPVLLLHKLNASAILPPMWLMSLLWLGFYVLWGAAFGELLSCLPENPAREVYIWRGSTFAVLAVVFSLVWYTLLFGKYYLVPSWLCLLISALASCVCGYSWCRVVKWTSVIAFLFAIWNICLFFLQFSIILHL